VQGISFLISVGLEDFIRQQPTLAAAATTGTSIPWQLIAVADGRFGGGGGRAVITGGRKLHTAAVDQQLVIGTLKRQIKKQTSWFRLSTSRIAKPSKFRMHMQIFAEKGLHFGKVPDSAETHVNWFVELAVLTFPFQRRERKRDFQTWTEGHAANQCFAEIVNQ
jgi:hypothetical protein